MSVTMLTTSSPRSALARHSRLLTPGLRSFGPQVEAVAERLGWPLLDWQREVNAVTCEVHPSGVGWRYPTVIVTVPRQSGKSSWVGALMTMRSMVFPEFAGWYTSTTGQKARSTWKKWEARVGRAFPDRFETRLSNGEETLLFPGTGGFVKPFPPTPKSLHSEQGDLIVVDEPWALTPAQGDDLLQAIVPTQATRPWRQLVLLSTAGDDTSVWWRAQVERGRKSVGDPESRIAFFEWSADDGVDLTDPSVWPTYHPAFGTLITADAMQDALDQFGVDGFSRAYGNRWPPAEVSWRAAWPSLASEELIPPSAPVVLAADSSPDHRAASVVAVGMLDSGRHGVEVIDNRPGVDWVVGRLADLSRKHRADVVIERTGPLGYLIEELQRAGVRVTVASSSDMGDAVARFRTAVANSELAHLNDTRLNSAVDAAVSRRRGDRDIWARKDTTVDISTLVAASLALWKAAIPKVKPMVAAS